MKKYLFVLCFIAFWAGSASSYTRITSSSGHNPKWTSMPIPYWINVLGSPQIPNGSEFIAVQDAFQTWQNVTSANVRFDYRGTTSTRSVGRDNMNLVTFADDSTPLGSSTIAVTFSFFDTQDSTLTTAEADIVFNQALEFSTGGDANKFDIQSVMTHEIGHLLGLDHSGMVSSVMVPFAAPSQTDQRTLAYDDIAGVSEIYPNTSANPTVGEIWGFVLSGTQPVFGAHVVAMDQNGTPVVSAISQPTGDYKLRFLPPGAYHVYAEPLDLPITEQYIGGNAGSWYKNLKTDFGTTFLGNVSSPTSAQTITVAAGIVPATAADIQVLPRSATGLNLTRPGFAPRVARGERVTGTLGGQDITPGVSIEMSNSNLLVGSPTFGGSVSSTAPTSAVVSVDVLPAAPLGPKNFIASRAASTSVVTGGLVVVDPKPSGIQVAPSSGPTASSTPVTITGANFRPGARVYFGGLPATGVQILNSGSIQATAPLNTPGPATLLVMNADGTSGRASSSFNYFAPPPSISSVTPLSGPPSTVITIQGANFDTRPRSIRVLFNGIEGRVVTATQTSIQAIVPFGGLSGPITVDVFDQRATGPDFTMTALAQSTNRAGIGYNFIDASAASGGTTVSFNHMDDATATAIVPFTFSLFRDVYLAGSQISIVTNGFISLEAGIAPEFQNASLPTDRVVRQSGSIGTIPPSLIAPFFDDLILRAGVSSVTTRTIGVEPNRQFVVQWSKLSILDEDGRDQNASLTFQLVLFEGSNDIQFVYQSMSGPRSNGSSATVGIQDLRRSTAVQTGFNQPIIGEGAVINYRFADGAYTTFQADTTPPSTPVVNDGGAATSSLTSLSASWTSQDPESGIREYQYAIGLAPGATDIRPFTTTTNSSVTANGLTLQNGLTYYFAVRAINSAGLMSEIGVSDGIVVDTAFQAEVKVISWAPHGVSEFSGIALYAANAMSVVLRAIDVNGMPVSGAGVQNPVTISLAEGRQYARLVNELFGLAAFDGWIELEASAAGLGVYTATGGWDMSSMDGSIVRELASDFVMFHPGATAIMVNPSMQTATVTLREFGSSNVRTLTIAGRSRISTTITAVTRLESTVALAAIERYGTPGNVAVGMPVPVSSALETLVWPHAVTGAGYTSTLTLVNIASSPRDATIAFNGASRSVQLPGNGALRVSIADFLGIPQAAILNDAVRVSSGAPFFGGGPSLMGTVEIENALGAVSLGIRPATTVALYPHVAHGNGLFTGLSLATGASAATVTVEVYAAGGGVPKTATITMGPNEHLARLVSELVPSVTTQMGGYIRVLSTQPIWSWEIYGSDRIMASGPPL